MSPTKQWTYRHLIEDIDAVARLLHEEYAVRPGDRVAIVAANSAEYAIAVWGIVTVGAIVTSLNGWWTPSELQHGIELTRPVLVLGDRRRLARLQPQPDPPGPPRRELEDLVANARRYRGQPVQALDVDEDSPAVILFTSGTTGRPKGAILSHRNIVNLGLAGQLNAATGAVRAGSPPSSARGATIVTSPMFHISGLIPVLVSVLFYRTRLVFAPPGKWDPTTYLRLTQEHAITTWTGVPTQYWRLLRHPALNEYDISSVRNVGSGGAVFAPELVRELHARIPHVQLGNGYGTSETTGIGTTAGGRAFLDHPDSVGAPSPTVEVRIVGDTGALVGEDEIGEIGIRSPSVFLGYWADPAATARCLDADRWYRTGDFGRISEGRLVLESRRRDLILRAGENIYPIEIENRLVEHVDIDDAAVIGVEDVELGQRVKAFVVVRPGAELAPTEIEDWCRVTLAPYKIPEEIEFRDALPYSVAGKLLKIELEGTGREARPANVMRTSSTP